jgi:hypothetical protein
LRSRVAEWASTASHFGHFSSELRHLHFSIVKT